MGNPGSLVEVVGKGGIDSCNSYQVVCPRKRPLGCQTRALAQE